MARSNIEALKTEVRNWKNRLIDHAVNDLIGFEKNPAGNLWSVPTPLGALIQFKGAEFLVQLFDGKINATQLADIVAMSAVRFECITHMWSEGRGFTFYGEAGDAACIASFGCTASVAAKEFLVNGRTHEPAYFAKMADVDFVLSYLTGKEPFGGRYLEFASQVRSEPMAAKKTLYAILDNRIKMLLGKKYSVLQTRSFPFDLMPMEYLVLSDCTEFVGECRKDPHPLIEMFSAITFSEIRGSQDPFIQSIQSAVTNEIKRKSQAEE